MLRKYITGDIITMPHCKKHNEFNCSCDECCAIVMGDLDEEIKINPKLAKQMDNSFMYTNEG